jgi:hypothetical protein
MSKSATPIIERLRALADELESAERYGVPLPDVVSAVGYPFGGASFHVDPLVFQAWADYTEATVEEYDHEGDHWRRCRADVNGLLVEFATTTTEAVPA